MLHLHCSVTISGVGSGAEGGDEMDATVLLDRPRRVPAAGPQAPDPQTVFVRIPAQWAASGAR